MLKLRDVPEPTYEESWEYENGTNGRAFIIWPADVGSELVSVRVDVTALSDHIGGDGLGRHTGKIRAALEQYRDVIQELAQSKYQNGVSEVTLDRFG